MENTGLVSTSAKAAGFWLGLQAEIVKHLLPKQ
jgi:hypothetical protein